MFRVMQAGLSAAGARRAGAGLILAGALAWLGGCSGSTDLFNSNPPPEAPPQAATAIGTGQVKVGLILPLTAPGNAGVAAQSMKNAAEMALAEFNSPNV